VKNFFAGNEESTIIPVGPIEQLIWNVLQGWRTFPLPDAKLLSNKKW
jgi:hypothetical protein